MIFWISRADTLDASSSSTKPARGDPYYGQVGNDHMNHSQTCEALEAVKLTLRLGADVNGANNGGFTPLHRAAVRGADSIVELLVSRGARLDEKTQKERCTAPAIAKGVFMANPYKAQPPTAEVLRKLMGLPAHPETAATQ